MTFLIRIALLCALLAAAPVRAQFGLAVQTNGDLRVHTNFHGATIQMPTQRVVFAATPRIGTNDIATVNQIVAGTVTNGQWLGDLANYLPLAGGTVTGATTFALTQIYTNLGGHTVSIVPPSDYFTSPAIEFTIDEGDVFITNRLEMHESGRLQANGRAFMFQDEGVLLSGSTMSGTLVAPVIQIGSATLAYTGGALRTTGVWQHYDAFDSYAMRRIYKVNDAAGSSSWGNLIEQYYIFGESAANGHWAMGVASNWSSAGYATFDGIRWSPDLSYSNFVLQLSRNGQISAGPGGTFVGAFSGNGAGLTNLPSAGSTNMVFPLTNGTIGAAWTINFDAGGVQSGAQSVAITSVVFAVSSTNMESALVYQFLSSGASVAWPTTIVEYAGGVAPTIVSGKWNRLIFCGHRGRYIVGSSGSAP